VAALVSDALAEHGPLRRQRVAAYALVRRDDAVLLTRLSARAAHPGAWTLPGGGIDHGERPAVALAREVEEECGLSCRVGDLLDVHDTHFSGHAPSGRIEDYHGVHLIFAATVDDGEPRVAEVDGTTDAVAWVPVTEVASGDVRVLELVRHALGLVP
jgi:ADP-ribose pyrophosphatase YjhB (NUDIX family)